jgi:arylsulfatase A-like enzyme
MNDLTRTSGEATVDRESPSLLDWALATALSLALIDGIVDLEARAVTSPNPLRSEVQLGTTVLIALAVFVVFALIAGGARALLRFARGSTGPAATVASGIACLPALLAAWRAVDPAPKQVAAGFVAAAALAIGVAWAASQLLRHVPGFPRFLRVLALAPVGVAALGFGASLSGREPLAGRIAIALGAALIVLAFVRSVRRPALVLAPCAIALLSLAAFNLDPRERAPGDSGAPTGRPTRHVLLVVVDTLRADSLSCYSPNAKATPVIDALASESLLFEQSRSAAPWTYPSMGSILSGLLPAAHCTTEVGVRFAPPVPTIAMRMAEAGYRTAAFVRNPVLWRTSDLDRGFQEYHFYREPRAPTSLADSALRVCVPDVYAPRVGADAQCRDAAQWIAENADRDFFVWLHLFDPHMTYEPPGSHQPKGEPAPRVGRKFADAARTRGGFFNPDAAERKWIAELYDGEVRFLDSELARVFDALRAADLWDDTLVVFTADHGEEFWEHGAFEHGHAMYDETVKVPWIVKLPGSAPKGRVAEDVCNASIVPTILELCGVPYEGNRLSALPVLKRGVNGAAELVNLGQPHAIQANEYFEGKSALVFDGHKYIRWEVSGREELYDLRADPGETIDLAAREPELVAKARKLLDEHRTRSAVLREDWGILQTTEGELDPDVERDRSEEHV